MFSVVCGQERKTQMVFDERLWKSGEGPETLR